MLRIFTFFFSLFTPSDISFHGSSPSLAVQNRLQQGRLQRPLEPHLYDDHREWVEPMSAAQPLQGEYIKNRTGWVVTCDSEQDKLHTCQAAIDGSNSTFWLAHRTNSNGFNYLTVDLGFSQNVSGIAVNPRQDGTEDGNILAHDISVSEDGYNYKTVSYGTWWSDNTEKYSSFQAVQARHVRIIASSDATSSATTAISEFNVFVSPINTRMSENPSVKGTWGPTVNTPVVPVTGFVDPHTHQVIFLSSKRHDNFAQDRPDFTLIATWDPKAESVSQAKIEHTHHNMFCPGTTLDVDGRIIISGGSTGSVTTIFDGRAPEGKQWIQGADLVYTRGYQGAVLQADGRMFVLGGSWGDQALVDPEQKIKNGEIYDPKADKWTLLPKCLATPMMTADRQRYRRDNHPWLFTWANETIFHAGPSKNMNWYSTVGKGGWKSAGTRSSGGDTAHDAMNGQALMYDATRGKILAFGGAEHYLLAGTAHSDAHIITIGEPNGTVLVEKVDSMANARAYATAVLTPHGDVLIAGGQHGVPVVFNDTNPVLETEMFTPDTGHWQKLAHNTIVRVYHSISLLLPDARVLAGGSGLCGDSCGVNHFDAEIYTPPYLYTSDGQLAKRPIITDVSPSEVKPGDTIFIKSDSALKTASIIRYGATTHTVNNDQKRIPLPVSKSSDGSYAVSIPFEGYIALPGYWMLFVMDEHDVPSVASTIKIDIADDA